MHQKLDLLTGILTLYRRPNEPVLFLGDFFDDWHDTPADAQRMAEWLVHVFAPDPLMHALLGNHDLGYLFVQPIGSCSGYTPQKREAVRSVLASVPSVAEKIDVFARVGPWLISHAGVHPYLRAGDDRGRSIARGAGLWSAAAMACAEGGLAHPLFACGVERGGRSPVGGPLWLDWDREFEDDNPEMPPQIVGHTPHAFPMRKGFSWCLDTHLRHFARLDETTFLLTIHEAQGGRQIVACSPPIPSPPPLSAKE